MIESRRLHLRQFRVANRAEADAEELCHGGEDDASQADPKEDFDKRMTAAVIAGMMDHGGTSAGGMVSEVRPQSTADWPRTVAWTCTQVLPAIVAAPSNCFTCTFTSSALPGIGRPCCNSASACSATRTAARVSASLRAA